MREFKSTLTIDGIPLEKSFKFPGGEIQIRLPQEIMSGTAKKLTIKTILNSPDAILELILTRKALKHYQPIAEVILIAWYLPYLRQDRICAPGECHSARVLIDTLISLDFSEINTADIHSDKSIEPFEVFILDSYVLPTKRKKGFMTILYNRTKLRILRSIRDISNVKSKTELFYDVIIAPDKGAEYKVKEVADYYGTEFALGHKQRNPDSGLITSYDLSVNGSFNEDDLMNFFNGKKVLVMDDIADGGGTFVLLAEKLKKYNPRQFDLFVTHGIFSKGVDILYNAGYSTIITTDSLPQSEDCIVHGDSFKVLQIPTGLISEY